MNIAAIVKNIDWGRQERAEYVRLVSVKYGRSKTTGQPRSVAKAYSKREGSDASNRYTSQVICLDGDSNVKVSCSCPDFYFHGWEYALSKQGAADIIYGNGQAPQKPVKPGCCKHLFYHISQLVKSGKLHPRGLVFYDARKEPPKPKPTKLAVPQARTKKVTTKKAGSK